MRVSAFAALALLAGARALPQSLGQTRDWTQSVARAPDGGIWARQEQANAENQDDEENRTYTQEEYDARVAENKAKQKIIDIGTTGRQAIFQKLGCRFQTTESELQLEGITRFLEKEIDACLPRFLNLKPEEQDEIIAEVKSDWAEDEKKKKEEEERMKKEEEEEEKEKKEDERKKGLEKLGEDDDNLWVSEDANTNTMVAIGDEEVSFGTELNPVDAIKEIKKQCGEQGCAPDTPLVVRTQQVINMKGVERNLLMKVDGTWASKGKLGNLNQLLDTLELTIEELKKNEILRTEKLSFKKGPCTAAAHIGYLCKDKTVYEEDQIYVPSFWQIVVRVPVPPQDEDSQEAEAVVADLKIKFEVEEVDEDAGWCGSVAGGVAGIAGAITNPAGPVVAGGILVGAIFCNAIP